MKLGQFVSQLGHEFKRATLSYRQAPVVFAIIVLLVATGVAANTLAFGLYDAILIRMLPVHQPSNLVELIEVRSGLPPRTIFPAEVYRQISDTSASVYDVLAQCDVSLSFQEVGHSERVYVQGISRDYFSALGVGALRGRLPAQTEDRVAVLSYQFWKREFQGDSPVIGKTIRVDGRLFPVIGITPPGFNGTSIDQGPDIWIPLDDLKSYFAATDQPMWVEIVARLRLGYSLNQAQQEVASLVNRVIDKANTGRYLFESKYELQRIASGTSQLRDGYKLPLIVLLVGTGLLVVIVSSNVAGLLLGRAIDGERDTAVRLALGATRSRVFSEWLAVGLVPTILGALLGMSYGLIAAPSVGHWIPAGSPAYYGTRPVPIDVRVDARVIACWVLATCVAAIVAAIGPALHAARRRFALALRTATSNPAHRRLQEGLSSFQLAMTLIFVVVAGWLLSGLRTLQHINTGMDIKHVLTFSIDTEMSHYTIEHLRSFQNNLLRRVLVLPGVEAAGLSQLPVLQGARAMIAVVSAGAPRATGPNAALNNVSDGYFESMGMHLMKGRLFNNADRDDTTSIMPIVVNETFAREFAGSSDPVGWRFSSGLHFSKPTDEIIGVVSDAKYRSVEEPIPPTLYVLGFDSNIPPPPAFVLNVRVRGQPSMVLNSIRQTFRSLDPTLPINRVSTLAENVQLSLAPQRSLAVLALGVSALSVLLATIGLYGVLNQFVAGARRDIAVRLALGAGPGDIVRLVSRRLLPVLLLGAGIGTVILFAIGRSIRALMYGFPLSDLHVYIFAGVVVAMAVATGAALPTIRALRVEPAELLRQE